MLGATVRQCVPLLAAKVEGHRIYDGPDAPQKEPEPEKDTELIRISKRTGQKKRPLKGSNLHPYGFILRGREGRE